MNTINTKAAELHFDAQSRILHIRLKEKIFFFAKEEQEYERAVKVLVRGSRYLKMVQCTRKLSRTREAKALFTSLRQKNLEIARAMIVGSSWNRVLINFYIRLRKPATPTRIFTCKVKAQEWLGGFLFLTENSSLPLSN